MGGRHNEINMTIMLNKPLYSLESTMNNSTEIWT